MNPSQLAEVFVFVLINMCVFILMIRFAVVFMFLAHVGLFDSLCGCSLAVGPVFHSHNWAASLQLALREQPPEGTTGFGGQLVNVCVCVRVPVFSQFTPAVPEHVF